MYTIDYTNSVQSQISIVAGLTLSHILGYYRCRNRVGVNWRHTQDTEGHSYQLGSVSDRLSTKLGIYPHNLPYKCPINFRFSRLNPSILQLSPYKV